MSGILFQLMDLNLNLDSGVTCCGSSVAAGCSWSGVVGRNDGGGGGGGSRALPFGMGSGGGGGAAPLTVTVAGGGGGGGAGADGGFATTCGCEGFLVGLLASLDRQLGQVNFCVL